MTEVPYSETQIVPPPWKLHGDGLILLYRFSSDFVDAHCGVTPAMGRYLGGLGAVILADYQASDVGPYRELLFVPGRFEVAGKKAHSISQSYASTTASVVSGRTNWAIPKAQADFHRAHEGDAQSWRVSVGERDIFRVTYAPGRVAFRFWTWPFFAPLIQHVDGQTFVTRISAHGVLKLAQVHDLQIDPAYFPDVTGIQPVGILRATRLKMTFPRPRMV
ncbi:MAG: acetoacetate decarboxylase family protein [Anaerolineae bacterium]|nr:acetoacetate decarboxylase family protein [Anaerolineae bacterium]